MSDKELRGGKSTEEVLKPLLYACEAVNMLNTRNAGARVAALLKQRDALADALRDACPGPGLDAKAWWERRDALLAEVEAKS